MVEVAHALLVDAAQHIRQMTDAVTLARAVDTGQRLLRQLRAIERYRRIVAIVAISTIILFHDLAEIGKQVAAPAGRDFRITEQCIELGALDALAFLARFGLGDELRQRNHVAKPVAHPRLSRQAVERRGNNCPGRLGHRNHGLDAAAENSGRE